MSASLRLPLCALAHHIILDPSQVLPGLSLSALQSPDNA